MGNIQNKTVEVDSIVTIQEIIKAFFLDDKLTDEQETFLKENYKNIQEFLDAPLNSPKDAETKKIFAKVILLAKQRNILPQNLSEIIPVAKPNETVEEKKERIEDTAEVIAETVDQGLDNVKIPYHVEEKGMKAQDAFNHFVDKAVVRISKVTDKIVDKGFDWFVKKGAKKIEMACPKLIPVVEIAKRAVVVVKPIVKTAVKTGIKIIGNTVKQSVKVGKVIWGGIKSGVSKVASLFGF